MMFYTTIISGRRMINLVMRLLNKALRVAAIPLLDQVSAGPVLAI